ncbi:MAG: hypothetical protein ABIH71_05870 [Candidatus Omnitrophota bacterium]|nr:hypothetical protein [Candidatus Omnitrophota bacterium]
MRVLSFKAGFLMFLFTAAVLVCGCAGSRFMSISDGYHKDWGMIPYKESLSVKVFATDSQDKWNDKDLGQIFTERLVEKFEKEGIFDEVFIISSAEAPKTRLVLEGAVEIAEKSGYAARLFVPSTCKVNVSGKLVDARDKVELFIFTKSRDSQGGLLGAGGLLSASSKTMVKELTQWVADDVAGILRNDKKKR